MRNQDKYKKEHMCWKKMRERCNNPNKDNYHNYGGRGISVCDRWSLFVNFLEDMGTWPDYHQKWSIERVDYNQDYCSENCKWILLKDQWKNKRAHKPNTSGTVGVYKNGKGWVAEWWIDGKRFKKYFKNKEDAIMCRYENTTALLETETL